MKEQQYAKGLEGVIAAESKICKIDGAAGLLSYRGYRIEDLAEHCDFERVTYLLLNGTLPSKEEEARFRGRMRAQRPISKGVIAAIREFPRDAHPMDILQAMVLFVGAERHAAGAGNEADADDASQGEHLIAQLATIVAAIYHIQRGSEIIAPRDDLGHGANFLYMLHGSAPSKIAGEVIDTCFTLHAEHGLNASTFAARVIVSTLASYYSSVSGAIGSLSGALHGGANEKVLQMVDEIGERARVDAWVDDALAQKRRIMGMGHRVYRTKDPRSYIIERLLGQLHKELPHHTDYTILKMIETRVGAYMRERGKPIYPNVDFFSGAAYRMLGIPTNLFTTLFAVARVAGWMAHINEQLEDNRIYRPKRLYTGNEITAIE